jgi:DNA-binding MarR family transcriptional regulator
LSAKQTKRASDVRRLLLAIKPLADMRSPMPLSYLKTFLLVASEEGRGVSEIAREFGLAHERRRIMTRFIQSLTKKPRKLHRGLDLLEVRPHQSIKRKKAIFLSDKGRELLARMLQPISD